MAKVVNFVYRVGLLPGALILAVVCCLPQEWVGHSGWTVEFSAWYHDFEKGIA